MTGRVVKRSTAASSGTKYAWKTDTYQQADFWNMEGVEVEFNADTPEAEIEQEMDGQSNRLQAIVQSRALTWRQEQES